MTPLEVLDKLEQLFRYPDNWTKGAEARDRYGRIVAYNDPNACKWCLVGGIRHVYRGDYDYDTDNRLDELLTQLVTQRTGRTMSHTYWNDYVARSSRDVYELIQEAKRHV